MRALPLLLLAACGNETPLSSLESDAPPPRDPEAIVDVVVQPEVRRVDVLFVVDDSGSMADDQQALTEAFPELMAWFELEDLDYHIGVVSTDTMPGGPAGQLRHVDGRAWIDRDTPDPVDAFTQLAALGTGGSTSERGLLATYQALQLERDGANAGFLRADASLHTIVVSDEDDDTPDSLMDPETFSDWYGDLKAQRDERSFSAIVHTDGDQRGDAYLAVSSAIGGAQADLQDNWLLVLDSLGGLVSAPKVEYFLSRFPVEDSLGVVVEVTGKRVSSSADAWVYDPARNAVQFVDLEVPPGGQVTMSYRTR